MLKLVPPAVHVQCHPRWQDHHDDHGSSNCALVSLQTRNPETAVVVTAARLCIILWWGACNDLSQIMYHASKALPH